MKCLNCGHAVHQNTTHCHHCNIPVNAYGVIHDNAPLDESPVKDAGPKCPNCNKIQDYPFAHNCESCNYPLSDKSGSQNKSNQNTGNVATGFSWNRIANEKFSANLVSTNLRMFSNVNLEY